MHLDLCKGSNGSMEYMVGTDPLILMLVDEENFESAAELGSKHKLRVQHVIITGCFLLQG